MDTDKHRLKTAGLTRMAQIILPCKESVLNAKAQESFSWTLPPRLCVIPGGHFFGLHTARSHSQFGKSIFILVHLWLNNPPASTP
jgi:hypothetical protein